MTRNDQLRQLRFAPAPDAVSVLRVLALLGLFLLPIQLRAGTTYVHPHALLHLLLDASDNEIDHHHIASPAPHGHGEQGDHAPVDGAASPDLPTFASLLMAGGGLAVTLVTLPFFLMTSTRERVWPSREDWRDRRLRPDFPPPRLCGC